MRIFWGVIAIVIVIAGFVITRNNQNNPSLEPILSKIGNLTAIPTPTPMPFVEMTIPHLRAREYKSELGEMQKLSENTSYTSFLTSYDSDGLRINGLLTIPKGAKPEGGWPGVVFVHGYIAPTIYRTTERYQDYVNYLARNGFVVFKIDLRGHGSSEGEAGGAYYSEDYIVDTLNAHAALANADFVNPSAIGLWGHSMAGNVTSRALAARPNIPAVVIWAGAGYTYTDLSEYRINDQSYRPPEQNTQRQRRRQLLADTYGAFNAESPFWSQVAITNYIGDIKGAIALHHAVNDNVVSVEYSRNLKKLLDGTSIPHEVFEYPTGGHNLEGSAFGQAMSRTVEFYKRHLK